MFIGLVFNTLIACRRTAHHKCDLAFDNEKSTVRIRVITSLNIILYYYDANLHKSMCTKFSFLIELFL